MVWLVDPQWTPYPRRFSMYVHCAFVGCQTTIDILKIDIECSEWSAFDAILASPRCVSNVKQLLVEFHPCDRATSSAHQLLHYWRTLRGVDRLGFKLWRVWNNFACKFTSRRLPGAVFYGCFNAYYLNVNYLAPKATQ